MTTTTTNNDHNTTANTCSNNHNNENNDDHGISSTAKGSIHFKYLVLDILREPDLHLFVCMVRDFLRNH